MLWNFFFVVCICALTCTVSEQGAAKLWNEHLDWVVDGKVAHCWRLCTWALVAYALKRYLNVRVLGPKEERQFISLARPLINGLIVGTCWGLYGPVNVALLRDRLRGFNLGRIYSYLYNNGSSYWKVLQSVSYLMQLLLTCLALHLMIPNTVGSANSTLLIWWINENIMWLRWRRCARWIYSGLVQVPCDKAMILRYIFYYMAKE